MRAVVYYEYGKRDVLRVEERPMPSAKGTRVNVSAAALNPKDGMVRSGKLKLLTWGPFPRSCGYDFAGQVVESGEEVFGMVNSMVGRTCAEQIVVGEQEFAPKPPTLSMAEAAALPLVGQTALQALRDHASLEPGQQVVINGASGGVGTVALQVAAAMGAEITAICSAKNAQLCRSLGAHKVVAYDEVEPLEALSKVDIFFDIFGNFSLRQCRPVMNSKATFVSTVPTAGLVKEIAFSALSKQRAKLVVVKSRRKDLETLAQWVAEKKLKSIVDRVLPLSEVVEAQAYLESRRAKGKVVIDIGIETVAPD